MPDQAVSFRGEYPAELVFGTSGLRGLVSDITDLEAYINTLGFLEYLTAVDSRVTRSVALGGDLRPSTDSPDRSILRAVARACMDAGFSITYSGKLPTPALAYYAFGRGIASIMVTGSHIPFDRNGIKFNMPDREVLKSDERGISQAVASVRVREYEKSRDLSLFDDGGMFRAEQAPCLPEVDDTARQLYLQRYLDFFPPGALRGLVLAVYQHSAVGRDVLSELLSALGATVHAVGRSEGFVAIDTEAIDSARLAELDALLAEARVRFGPIDALVSTDGDSDRPLLCGVGAEGRASFVNGDRVGILAADYLGADALAVPVSATDAIEAVFADRAELVRTRIGSPWVIAAMQQLNGERRVGWEANGGFLVGSSITRDGRRLEPLATRDAALPLLCVLHAAKLRGLSVAELDQTLPARFGQAGLIDVTRPAGPLLRHYQIRNIPDLVSVSYSPAGPEWTDQHGRARLASPAQAEQLGRVRSLLECALSSARGFAAIRSINFLDGIRCSFDNGDVAHVRASGNAPQLRMYALASSPARAQQIVDEALRAGGTLEALLAGAEQEAFVEAILTNLALTQELFAQGDPAGVIGMVSGSAAAQRFWQRILDQLKPQFRAAHAISFHEDLPTNQAFGLLLLWQRLRSYVTAPRGALIAFVFGEGSRATPFTEAEGAQKPAMASFVRLESDSRRFQSMVGLALRCFAPVEAFLRRSGFEGVVVKWGDEVQIPSLDLSGSDALFEGADVVRFVSMRVINEADAKSKDWIGVDARGNVTAFIPRRPLAEMPVLAERGLLQRRGNDLVGGINLGSIAVSCVLLDALLDEFATEVNDATANRKHRPDLDPQFFTVLMIALGDDEQEMQRAFDSIALEVPALAELRARFPDLLGRLRKVVEGFRQRHGRKPRVVAMDFGDQYWGDIGQHRQIYQFFMALGAQSAEGRIARALAGLGEACDDRGNWITPGSHVSPEVVVRNSVLIDCDLFGSGSVEGSVLIGTCAGNIDAREAFDVESCVSSLRLAPRSGTYKVLRDEPVAADVGERLTTLFLPGGRELLMRVQEDLDLRDRATNYERVTGENPISFAEAHRLMGAVPADELDARRASRRKSVRSRLAPREG